VFSVQCSVFSVQCSVFSVQCPVFSVQWSVFARPTHDGGAWRDRCIPQPSPLSPNPAALNPQPSTLTSNPQHQPSEARSIRVPPPPPSDSAVRPTTPASLSAMKWGGASPACRPTPANSREWGVVRGLSGLSGRHPSRGPTATLGCRIHGAKVEKDPSSFLSLLLSSLELSDTKVYEP